MGNLWADRPAPLDCLLRFRNDVALLIVEFVELVEFFELIRFVEPLMSNLANRTDDIVKAVHLLRQHGMPVGFPMQTANGEVIFSVGKDFTLTADQILELLKRGELHAEGVRKSVEAQASAKLMRKQAASS